MGFRFQWYDEDKTVMHLIAEGDWNWRDYHVCARASSFSMLQHPYPVHTLLDFRASTRPKFPAGIAAHSASFGKKIVPALSGHVVVIGLPAKEQSKLALADEGFLHAVDGRVYFVEDEEQAQMRLAALQAADE